MKVDSRGVVDEMFGVPVIYKPIFRPGGSPFIPVGPAARGVFNPHTTEGYGLDAIWGTLNSKHAAPTLIAGSKPGAKGTPLIYQTRPIGFQGAALLGGAETNGMCDIQVEIEAFSKQALWQLVPGSFEATIAVMGFCEVVRGIPMVRPEQWPDDLSDLRGEILATSTNSRRKSGIVRPGFQGIAQHMEFKKNNHWNCGALAWAKLIEAKNELVHTFRFPAAKPVVETFIRPFLHLGDHGFKVEASIIEAQKLLDKKLEGIVDVTPDGWFGPLMQDATKLFQRRYVPSPPMKKLTVDGKIGLDTWAALLAV